MPARAPKKLVILSDLHVGSTLGVWPKTHKRLREGNPIGLNKLQEWLWECWQDGSKWVKDTCKDGYVLALNGDLIDGIHHKTTQVMSPLVDDQIDACIGLLTPLAKGATKVVATLGTESHTGNTEHAIASALGALPCADHATAWNAVHLIMNGVEVELMHHISSAGAPWGEATGHSQTLNLRRAERSRLGRQAPTVMIRGHRHRFGYWCDGAGLTVVTPSWQGLTRWAWKAVPGAECHVGFTVIDFTELEDGIIPRVRFRLYSPEAESPIIIK